MNFISYTAHISQQNLMFTCASQSMHHIVHMKYYSHKRWYEINGKSIHYKDKENYMTKRSYFRTIKLKQIKTGMKY